MIAKIHRWNKRRRLQWKITEPFTFLKTKRYYSLKQHLGLTNFKTVNLDKVLIGQQAGIPLDQWILRTKEYQRISVPISKSPYANFLKSIIEDPLRLTNESFLESTDYFEMMSLCIEKTGHYMSITKKKNLYRQADYFYELFQNFNNTKEPSQHNEEHEGRSTKNSPIKVKKILYSDCYEIVDGHHRSAIAHVKGDKTIDVEIIDDTLSYLQKIILKSQQTFGIELYQPLNKLEVSNWKTIRGCKDRFEMMKTFLSKNNYSKGSYLDMPCSYGFFVQNMKELGYDSKGIDIDQSSIQVAHEINGLTLEIQKGDIIKYLENTEDRFDVVSCMSLIHHFVMGRIDYPYVNIIKGLDKVTKKVLFIDTGQNHEKQYKGELDLWDDAYIINQILENTSFKNYEILGKDSDNTGTNTGKNGRSFFAFTR